MRMKTKTRRSRDSQSLNEELRTELNKKDAEIAALRGEVAAIRDDRDRLKAGVVALIKQIEDMRIGLETRRGGLKGYEQIYFFHSKERWMSSASMSKSTPDKAFCAC